MPARAVPDDASPDDAVERTGEAVLEALDNRTLSRDELAEWAGISKPHAKRLWGLVEDELTAVKGHGHALAEDAERLEDAPAHEGVTLLPPGDPLLLSRDRETLLPDPDRRKQLWRSVGSAGAILADGAVAGTWRARKKGNALQVEIEAFGRLDERAFAAAAEALAPHRGAESATVT